MSFFVLSSWILNHKILQIHYLCGFHCNENQNDACKFLLGAAQFQLGTPFLFNRITHSTISSEVGVR